MQRMIRRAAVVGAGTMGAQIAAHLANVGLQVDLLDLPPADLTPAEAERGLSLTDPEVANRPVTEQFRRAMALKPSPLFVPSGAEQIRLGNTRDHLSRLAEADWVIEAVVERLPIKREVLAAIESHRRPGTLVSSNTSGLSITAMSEGRGPDFLAHFCGTHFFNPPRYLHLLELIPTAATDPAVVEFLSDFGSQVLGKGIVVCRDTPYFIGNRIGCFAHSYSLHAMMKLGYGVDEVDVITGEPMLRPKSATLRLADIVGLDLMVDVGRNLYDLVPDDPWREFFRPVDFLEKMVEKGWRGEKSGQGFYRRVRGAGGSEVLTLDLNSWEYGPRQRPRFESIGAARSQTSAAARLRTLINGSDRASEFAWKTLSETLVYAAEWAERISEDLPRIDNAMKWGWNWELGPFEQWDALGVAAVVERLEAEQRYVPELARNLARTGGSFYREDDGHHACFHVNGWSPVPQTPGVMLVRDLKASGKTVHAGAEASLIDLGEGILGLELHTKVNVLSEGALEMLRRGLGELDRNWDGMVVGNQGRMFSAGANLAMLLASADAGDWDDIDHHIQVFQNTLMSVKYSRKPVVSAIFHQTLGGGCELALQSGRVQAAAETYIGLVELAVGLIPAGGGCTEMVLRSQEHLLPSDTTADRWSLLHRAFQNIGMAKTSTSGAEAREMGFLRPQDGISVNPRRHLLDARNAAVSLARGGYDHGCPRRDIVVLGEPALARFKLEVHMMHRAGYLTDHDRELGMALARILSGGDLSGPRMVSEQYLLDLEREEFKRLCGFEKTRDRIRHMLKTNRPLRN